MLVTIGSCHGSLTERYIGNATDKQQTHRRAANKLIFCKARRPSGRQQLQLRRKVKFPIKTTQLHVIHVSKKH